MKILLLSAFLVSYFKTINLTNINQRENITFKKCFYVLRTDIYRKSTRVEKGVGFDGFQSG